MRLAAGLRQDPLHGNLEQQRSLKLVTGLWGGTGIERGERKITYTHINKIHIFSFIKQVDRRNLIRQQMTGKIDGTANKNYKL